MLTNRSNGNENSPNSLPLPTSSHTSESSSSRTTRTIIIVSLWMFFFICAAIAFLHYSRKSNVSLENHVANLEVPASSHKTHQFSVPKEENPIQNFESKPKKKKKKKSKSKSASSHLGDSKTPQTSKTDTKQNSHDSTSQPITPTNEQSKHKNPSTTLNTPSTNQGHSDAKSSVDSKDKTSSDSIPKTSKDSTDKNDTSDESKISKDSTDKSENTHTSDEPKKSSTTEKKKIPVTSTTSCEPNRNLKAKPELKSKKIFIIGANTYLGFEIARKFAIDYQYPLSTSNDWRDEKDEFYRVRSNGLREEFRPLKSKIDSVNANLCDSTKDVASRASNANIIIHAESDHSCLDKLIPSLNSKQTLIILRSWTDAYDTDSSNDEKLQQFSESDASPLLKIDTPATIIELRYSDVVGPLSTSKLLILHEWCDQLTSKKDVIYYKHPKVSTSRDYIAIEDLIEAVHSSMTLSDNKYHVFNVGSGISISQVKVLQLVMKVMDLKSQVVTRDYGERYAKLPPKVSLNIDEAIKSLKFCPSFSNINQIVQSYTEWYASHYFPQDFAMSTYLTREPDPQRSTKHRPDQFKQMQDYYFTFHQVSHRFKSIIFCDECSSEFIGDHTTPWLSFHHVKSAQNRPSPNDDRFYIFRDFLTEKKKSAPSQRYVPKHTLFSDLFDVTFNKNPFDFMRNYEQEKKRGNKKQEWLYPGRDSEDHTVGSNGWMVNRVRACSLTEKMSPFKDQPLLNAGVCGGNFNIMLEFVTNVAKELSMLDKNHNCNMPAYNLVTHRDFADRYRTGVPFTSPFWEKSRDPQYYICHK